MTDQENAKAAATAEAADEARDNRAHRILFVLGIIGAIGVFLVGGVMLWQLGQLDQQDTRISHLVATGNDTAKQAGQLADQVRGLGATPVVQPAVPAPSGPTVVPVPIPGPGPTQAQIDDAVTAYLSVHPPAAGKSATPAMVATAVADFLTAHPPQPGQPPTPQEIATAAADYFSAHSSQFAGATGQTGAAGKDATDAQVKAAVDAYCSHGNCGGPKGDSVKGDQGPQGVSFTDLQFHRDGSGTCRAIAYFHDPATGKDSQVTHSAGDAACPAAVAPLIPTKVGG